MTFLCSYCWEDGEHEQWDGNIDYIKSYESYYEIHIKSRSSIRVLVGRSTSGLFACMPDFFAGCHLSSLSDLFYNKEKLIYALKNGVDGTTVAYALKKLSDKLKI